MNLSEIYIYSFRSFICKFDNEGKRQEKERERHIMLSVFFFTNL